MIIGGGIAGGNAAATLREEGFAGPVVIVSREPGVPFGRPPLSKTYLRSEEDLKGWYVRPAGWYAEHDVDLRNGSSVAGVDPAAHTVVLGSGEELRYQKMLIATGGRNRRSSVPGAELPGIHYLRTVAECDAIKQEAVAGRRAVVVGMGFIGCEVAASLTQLGVHVTTVFPGRAPLEKVLGEQVGALIGGIHRAKGVELLAGDQVSRVRRDRAAGGGRDRRRSPDRRATSPSRASGSFPRLRPSRDRRSRRTTGSWPMSCAGPARLMSTWPATWRTSFTRFSAGSGSSITTTAKNRAPRRRGPCSARLPRMTTSIASGPINTSTKSSMSATSRSGTTSLSVAAWMRVSWSASTWWTGSCGQPLGSTAAVIPNWIATRRWRPVSAWWPRRARPARGVLVDERTDLWSLPVTG